MEWKFKEPGESEVEVELEVLRLELEVQDLGLGLSIYLWCVQSRVRGCSRCPVIPRSRRPADRPWSHRLAPRWWYAFHGKYQDARGREGETV